MDRESQNRLENVYIHTAETTSYRTGMVQNEVGGGGTKRDLLGFAIKIQEILIVE